jgi:hypothetical protein
MTPFTPTRLKRWTMPDSYFGAKWPDYYSAGVGQSRDSDALERSNFECMLKALGGETETVIVVEESHWAVGWVQWIAIHESDGKALAIADDIRSNLDDYPIVNEDHFSELEWNEAADYWDSLSAQQKVSMAAYERSRCHWLAATPVWPFGRLDYYQLANRGCTISEAICESLRS